MIEAGTRTRANVVHQTGPTRHLDRGFSRDVGMSKNVTGSFTYGSNRITGANGNFAAFVLNDVLSVNGTNLQNGNFVVTGLDATNQAYLTVDPPPAAEGPVTSTVRTN